MHDRTSCDTVDRAYDRLERDELQPDLMLRPSEGIHHLVEWQESGDVVGLVAKPRSDE